MNICTLTKIIILSVAIQLFAASVETVTIESACANSVKIRWTGSATKEFKIYRTTQPAGDKSFLGSVDDSVKGAVDLTAQPNHTYYYYIEGIDIDLSSDMVSTAAKAVIPAIPGKPLQPSVALVMSGIIVSWTYINPYGGIHVYRSTNGGDYNLAATITSQSALSWIDNTVLSGASYSYKICGYNNCSEGEVSFASPTITTNTLPNIADLVIDSFFITSRGETLSGKFAIINRGEDSVLSPFEIDFYCNDSLINNWIIDKKIPVNSYLILPFEFKSKDTYNKITINSDCKNVIEEISEENNILTRNVQLNNIATIETLHSHLKKSSSLKISGNNLLLKNCGSFAISLIDLSGRCILQEKGYDSKTINLANIGKGSYFATIRIGNKIVLKQLIRN